MLKSFLAVSACCVAIACANGQPDRRATTESAVVALDIDGTWVGKTSQDRAIEFVIKGGAVSSLRLGMSLKLDAVCARPGSPVATDYRGGEATVDFSKPLPVASGKFTATAGVSDVDARVQGEFSQNGATGTIEMQAAPASGCSGTARLTWSAARAQMSK